MRESERRARNNRIRRNRQLRHRMMFGMMAVCLSIILAVTLGGTFSRAQEEGCTVNYKYFGSIMIEPGDTLTSIAQQYAGEHYDSIIEYVNEVVSINHLDSEHEIIAGEYLIVPYYSTKLQ